MLKPVDFEVGKHYKDTCIETVKPDTTIFKVDEYGDYYVSRNLGDSWKLINDVIKSFENTFVPFVDSIEDVFKLGKELERMAKKDFLIEIVHNEYRDEKLIYFKKGSDYVTMMENDRSPKDGLSVTHHNSIDFGFCIALADNEASIKFYKGGFREMKEKG